MRAQVKLLPLTVWITIWLLVIGATLVILGVFNEQLNWDIFSPQVERVLYGVFFSCIILSAFGVAITFVLGLKRIVEAVESLQHRGSLDSSIVPPKTQRLTYAGYMMGLLLAFSALIGVLQLADYRVQVHRSQVFRQIAVEQVQKFQDRISQPISQLDPISNRVPRPISDWMSALAGLSFVQNMTLYVVDPQDPSALWRYSNYQVNSKGEPFFERFLAAREYEVAIEQALNGDTRALEALNKRTNLIWYYVVKTTQDQSFAILRIEGNPNENFREYTPEPAYQQN